MRKVRRQLVGLSKELDLLIRKIKYKNSPFSLPISYATTQKVSLSYYSNTKNVFLSRKEIEEITTKKIEADVREIKENEFYQIIELVFEVKDYIKQFDVDEADYFELQLAIDELLDLVSMHIGYNKRVGKFYITEFLIKIREKICALEYDYTDAFRDKILYDLDHLIFRITTYYGKNQNQLFCQFSYLNDKEYIREELLEEKTVKVNIDEDFWDRMHLLCDDYFDDDELD